MIGKQVSRYRIVTRVGAGSTGTVYRATHSSLPLTVAIKFLSDELAADPAAKERFLRGVRAVAAIDHPNVSRFYEADQTDEGRLFLVMSYCDGETLRDRLKRGRCSVPEALLNAMLVADGLAHAHARGIIHRDIKPANLLLSSDSVIKIVDFGLAQLVHEGVITRSGDTPGTLMYMSPEQAKGERVDRRSDIFSLGVVLYEMLTGRPPFYAENAAAIVNRLTTEPHAPLRAALPDAPASLCRVVDRALEKDVERRYPRAEQMRDDLRAVLHEVEPGYEASRPVPRPPRRLVPAWLRRPPRRVLALAPVLAAAVLMVHSFEPSRPVAFAVMPLAEAAADSPDAQTRLAGLSQDITDRLHRFAADGGTHWVVPQDRIQLLHARTPSSAPGLLGSRRVLGVHAAPNSPPSRVELVRYDVDATAVFRARTQLDLPDGVFDSAGLDRTLRRMAGLRGGDSDNPGYTTRGDAYHDYLLGLGSLNAGAAQLDDAIAALRRAVDADSSFARAWGALGEGYRRRYDAARDSTSAAAARECCARALRLAPDLTAPHVTLGQLFASGNIEAAETEFRAALAVDPRDPVALRQLGNLFLSAGRAEDAEAAYLQGARANPLDAAAWEMLGYFYLTQARYRDAIAPFERDAAIAPDCQQTYNYLGACYFALDCWDEAMAMFERSFNLARTFVACANLGTLYYMFERYQDAADMYKWAREYSPANYEVAGYLAAAHYWIPGDTERAAALYREAIVLAEERRARGGSDPRILANLATLYAMTAHADSAVALAERAVAQAPEDPDVHYRASLAYEDLGQREKALRYVASAFDLGQSVRQIMSEPFLTELRADPRFEVIASGFADRPMDCGD